MTELSIYAKKKSHRSAQGGVAAIFWLWLEPFAFVCDQRLLTAVSAKVIHPPGTPVKPISWLPKLTGFFESKRKECGPSMQSIMLNKGEDGMFPEVFTVVYRGCEMSRWSSVVPMLFGENVQWIRSPSIQVVVPSGDFHFFSTMCLFALDS